MGVTRGKPLKCIVQQRAQFGHVFNRVVGHCRSEYIRRAAVQNADGGESSGEPGAYVHPVIADHQRGRWATQQSERFSYVFGMRFGAARRILARHQRVEHRGAGGAVAEVAEGVGAPLVGADQDDMRALAHAADHAPPQRALPAANRPRNIPPMRLDLAASPGWRFHSTPAGLPELDYCAAQRSAGPWTCQPHTVRRPHLLLLRTGVLALRYDDLLLLLTGGQALLLATGTRLAPAPGGGGSLSCWFGLRRTWAQRALAGLLPTQGARLLTPPTAAIEAGLACFHALDAGRDVLQARGHLLCCLGLCREAGSGSASAAPPWLAPVLAHLQAHPDEDDPRQLQALAGISHPHIACLVDSGVSDGHYFLAMEYIDGPSLITLLREHQVLPELYCLRMCRQVADGLAYAWAKAKLVHRDIKPENILVVRSRVIRLGPSMYSMARK